MEEEEEVGVGSHDRGEGWLGPGKRYPRTVSVEISSWIQVNTGHAWCNSSSSPCTRAGTVAAALSKINTPLRHPNSLVSQQRRRAANAVSFPLQLSLFFSFLEQANWTRCTQNLGEQATVQACLDFLLVLRPVWDV